MLFFMPVLHLIINKCYLKTKYLMHKYNVAASRVIIVSILQPNGTETRCWRRLVCWRSSCTVERNPTSAAENIRYKRRHTAANTKHWYNICAKSAQRRKRWADFAQMLYQCFVFAGIT